MTTIITPSPESLKQEHDLVVRQAQQDLSGIYNILSNLEKAQHQIGSFFPDLILLNKETNRPQFIVEITRNGNIARCLQRWKSVTDLPALLYLIVPESDRANARDISNALGIPIGLGFYKRNGDTITINYEE
jgi:hypothetical protein